MRAGWIALALLSAVPIAGAGAGAVDESFEWHLPRGFPQPAVPADNPMSAAKVALGRRLFFDPRLSVTGRYRCASCHDPARAYTDGRALALGATGESLPHNAMALVNVAYNISFGWDRPDLTSLEQQMLVPMLNEHPVELGLAGREASLTRALQEDPGYRAAFAAVFPQESAAISLSQVVKAIAAFERTLIFGDSPFDRYVFGGEHAALSSAAKQGMALFFSDRVGCAGCHSGFNFSGNWRDARGETGRAAYALNGVGSRPMRVPTLRNLALTAPYMHDGRFATLDEVLDHYTRIGAQPDSAHGGTRDPRLKSFQLSGAERAQLVAFLLSLTDSAVAPSRDGAGPSSPSP